jgi:hypothetical protein
MAHVPALLLSHLYPIECANGRTASLIWWNAMGNLLCNLPLQMKTDLVVEFLLNAIAPEQRSQA